LLLARQEAAAGALRPQEKDLQQAARLHRRPARLEPALDSGTRRPDRSAARGLPPPDLGTMSIPAASFPKLPRNWTLTGAEDGFLELILIPQTPPRGVPGRPRRTTHLGLLHAEDPGRSSPSAGRSGRTADRAYGGLIGVREVLLGRALPSRVAAGPHRASARGAVGRPRERSSSGILFATAA
jgi:hypothetical protein